MPTYDRDALHAQLKRHEGYRDKLYLDSEGILTVGTGHALGSIPLPGNARGALGIPGVMDRAFPPEVLEALFLHDAAEAEQQVQTLAHLRGVDFEALAPQRQQALVNMCFQMGPQRLGDFRRMWIALAAGDFDEAAREALDSRWAEQTPGRAVEVSSMIQGS